MLASLVMAIAIPEAFGDKALLFAGSYVAIQLRRHSFLTFAAADRARSSASGAGRILVWFVAAGALWGDHADQRLWSLRAVAAAAGVVDSRGP